MQLEYRFAKLVSFLLHPLLMPTYAVILLFNINTYIAFSVVDPVKKYLLGLVFLNTFLLPSIFATYLYYKGAISSLEMYERRERWLPFFVTLLFFGVTYFLIKQVLLPRPIYAMMLGSTLSILVCIVLNIFSKVSIHMVGLGGLLGMFYGLGMILHINTALILVAIALFAGVAGYARLKLNAHNYGQLITGFLVGFVVEYLPLVLGIG